MAPLPTIPNVFRVDLPWISYGGIAPVNVFHVETSSDDVQDIAAAIEESAPSVSGMWACMHESYLCQEFGITPLDGETPRIVVPFTGDAWHGGYGGQLIPSVAGVVSIRTGQRGSRGRGRLYLGPVSESAVEGGHIIDAALTLMREEWLEFYTNLLTASPVCKFGVASYVHSDFNQALSVQVDYLTGNQRRRQNQLR